MPSSVGQLRAVQAGWGVSVLPELLVRELVTRGELVNLLPRHRLSVMLYWHCWNLSSDVLEALTRALAAAAAQNLKSCAPQKTPPGRGSKRKGAGVTSA